MKILNLYAGIGGNRKMWDLDPDEDLVVAVEKDPEIAKVYQELYPNDKVVVGDAHEYLICHFQEFDFIWSSPPCPTHSRASTALAGHGVYRYPDMKLYEEILFLQKFCKVPFVVENVIPYYKPLVEPTTTIDRHHFWTNFPLDPIEVKRDYDVSRATKEVLAEFHGITLPEGTKNQRKLLRNAVYPPVGRYVFKRATED